MTQTRNAMPLITRTQATYLTHCGGCHGIEGVSVPQNIPTLKGQVGYFLCTPEGRRYLLAVPGVSYSLIRDDAELADVLNFVIFILGEGSALKDAKPFTAAEVAAGRAKPLGTSQLSTYRHHLVEDLITKCSAPESLLDYDMAHYSP